MSEQNNFAELSPTITLQPNAAPTAWVVTDGQQDCPRILLNNLQPFYISLQLEDDSYLQIALTGARQIEFSELARLHFEIGKILQAQ